jgi:hypothetical protein
MLVLMSPETPVPQSHPLRAIKKLADAALTIDRTPRRSPCNTAIARVMDDVTMTLRRVLRRSALGRAPGMVAQQQKVRDDSVALHASRLSQVSVEKILQGIESRSRRRHRGFADVTLRHANRYRDGLAIVSIESHRGECMGRRRVSASFSAGY